MRRYPRPNQRILQAALDALFLAVTNARIYHDKTRSTSTPNSQGPNQRSGLCKDVPGSVGPMRNLRTAGNHNVEAGKASHTGGGPLPRDGSDSRPAVSSMQSGARSISTQPKLIAECSSISGPSYSPEAVSVTPPPSLSRIPPLGISKNTPPASSGKNSRDWSPSFTQDRSILIAIQQASRAGATTKEIVAITGLPTAVINGTAQFGAGGSKYLWREAI